MAWAVPDAHVVKTDAAEAAIGEDSVVIRAAHAGTYNTELSNGRKVRSTIANVPAAIDLTKVAWHVAAEAGSPPILTQRPSDRQRQRRARRGWNSISGI